MKRFMATAILLLASGAATAQPTFSEVQRAAMAQQNTQVRITIGMNMIVPGASGLGSAALEAQEKVRRQIYELAKKECAVLREAFADDCRIEAVNVNFNRHQSPQQADGVAVNANMNFRVTLK